MFSLRSLILGAVLITALGYSLVAQDQDSPPTASPTPSAVQPDPNVQVYSRNLGSQIFEVDLGVAVPLFSHPSESGGVVPGAKLSVGGIGSLKWSAFLNKTFAVGADVSGMFALGINSAAFSMFPIGVRISNFFQLKGLPLEIPVHLTTAFNIMRYKDLTYLGIMFKAGASLYWDATKDWAFGLNVLWWWVPEFYTDPNGTPPRSQTRFANILEITVSAMYNF